MLVTLKEILAEAEKNKAAVGAFNVPTLEAVRAVTEAAEENNYPVILQHANGHNDKYIPIDIIGPILLNFAERAKTPICVHLDHGRSFELCMKAIRMGFTSVMYDASYKPYEDNLRETAEIVKISHALGISVEAELGHILLSSYGEGREKQADVYSDPGTQYTNPDQARAFADATGVDALAVSFGTIHGVYISEPVLNLEHIAKIRDKVNIPLVMHGGSGVSNADYRVAIANGIRKINYYTYGALAGGKAVVEALSGKTAEDKVFFHDIAIAATEGIKEDVLRAMKVFAAG